MVESQRTEAWKCGKCGKKWLDGYGADICCKQYHCEVCGVETRQFWLVCDSCRFKRRVEKAVLVEWDGKAMYDENSERYFWDWDGFFEYYECEDLTPPEFVFACTEHRPYINSEELLNDLDEEANIEDARIQFVDEHGLHEFVKQWNEKQTYRWYMVDHSKKIKVPKLD